MSEGDIADRAGAGVRFPPPLIFLGCLLLGMLADRLLDLPPWPFPWWIGAVVTVAGALLLAAAQGLFFGNGEDPKPWTATGRLIETGVYAHTRNPMYLGMAVAMLGLAMAFGSVVGALLVPVAGAVVTATVIAREEAYLQRKFGDAFLDYCVRVGRWW